MRAAMAPSSIATTVPIMTFQMASRIVAKSHGRKGSWSNWSYSDFIGPGGSGQRRPALP